jgi:hypothetical protein
MLMGASEAICPHCGLVMPVGNAPTPREYPAKLLRSVGDDRVIRIDVGDSTDDELEPLVARLREIGVQVHLPSRDGAL